MFKDKKNIAIVVLSFLFLIACYVCFFLAFHNNSKQIDETLLQTRLKQLQSENSQYEQIISIAVKKMTKYAIEIDSLQSLKPQIETRYVYKDKQIDAASVSTVVREYEGIFSNNNIK